MTIASILASCPLSGCGQSANAPPSADRAAELRLEQVGQMLVEFQQANGKAPASLKQLMTNSGGSLGGFELVKSGEVVVNWGFSLPDTKEEPGSSPNQEVLAFGKDVPEKGGPVLLLNRTVRQMTADEFKAAPQAAAASK